MTTRNPLILNNGLISEMTAGDAITASASIIISILNQTGATLTKGQAVYISGANGDNPTVSLASASAESTSSKTLGLVYADIANGNIGSVVTSGLFIGIDTSTATAGQSVWLSSTPGGLVFGAQPTQPLHGVFIGKVARVQQNNGSIFVTIQNGYEISELHDVLITSPANNNLIAYDSTTSLWKNVSAINGISVGSTTAAAGAFTTLSASSTVTLSAGTANGVLYLNGSKAATSGSALTFDGTNLGIGVAASYKLDIVGSSNIAARWTNIGSTRYGYLYGDNSGVGVFDGVTASGNGWYLNNASTNMFWQLGNSEQMRLNTTGLGIGTSSPSAKLHSKAGAVTQGAIIETSGANAFLSFADAGTSSYTRVQIGSSGNNFVVSMNGTTALTTDSSGNLGLGTTPNAWSSYYKVLQLSNGGVFLLGSGTNAFLGCNWYSNSSDVPTYTTTNPASYYKQNSGIHAWYTAPSGTAGTAITFTQAMTLSADGTFRVKGAGTAGSTDAFQVSGSAPASSFLLDSAGNAGIGTSSPAAKLDVVGNGDPAINTIGLKVGLDTYASVTSTQQYGIYVDQKGSRYAPQKGIYVNVDNPSGKYGGPYYGIDTYVVSASQAYQVAYGVSGRAENTWANYGTQAYGVKGVGISASGGGTVIANAQGSWGGHFTAYGLGNCVGVYADAYLQASPIAGAVAIPLLVASNGVEKGRFSSDGTFRVKGAGTAGSTDAFQVSGSAPASAVSVGSNGDMTINGLTVGKGAGSISSNIAVGASALASNTTGGNNTASGNFALNANTTGSYNTASSTGALYSNTTGSNNTASGYQALYLNTTGYQNTASGQNALYNNTTGNNNTASGYAALNMNTTGSNNTASGYLALYSNTTGSSNTASGQYSLRYNTTGHSNTASGTQALYSNTTGLFNTASGVNALYSNTIGNYNTASGYQALYNNTTGSGNTAINPLNSAGTYAPVFDPATENNRFCMGSTGVTNAYIQVAWTVVSDARDKTEFAPVPHGLAFVNQLKPTAYRYKLDRESTEAHGPIRYGFKAQDVLALEGDNPVIVDAEDADKLRFNDQSLLAVLVNAIQELKAELDTLKQQLGK